MKVLFINTVYGRGSTGRIVKELGEALEAQGDSYMVAYGRGKRLDDPHCYYIGGKLTAAFHAGLSRLTDRAGFYSTAATRKLLRFIRQYQPDVIHLHNLHGYYINISVLFRYLKEEFKGKVIWTLHDCWSMTGHCAHFTYIGCEKWKTECSQCPQKKHYPGSYLLDCACKNYRQKSSLFTEIDHLTVVTVSQWLKSIAEQSFLKKHPIRCIYNGIDQTKFRPKSNRVKQELGIGNKKMILLISNGWNARKGLDKVLAVAQAAPKDWQFVMIGLQPDQIKKLPSNITGIERVWDQEKLIEYYSAADVFFHPSVEETFGLVTAEAISCGTPAVVYDSTACPELIWDERCGRVLDLCATEEEVIAALEAAMQEKTVEGKETFSLKDSVAANLALYRE